MHRGSHDLRSRRRRWLPGALALAAALVGVAAPPPAAAAPGRAEDTAGATALYLVTLAGPGTAGHHGRRTADLADDMLADQDTVLDRVDSPTPVYRWTTAINGFAVRLDAAQARTLSRDRHVALVERDALRRLTAARAAAPGRAGAQVDGRVRAAAAGPGRDGAGTVIGFVDSGIDLDHRAFSDVTSLGAAPRFKGGCETAPDDRRWQPGECGGKVVGARHFVAGFGTTALRSNARLSPFDTDGHGTQVAFIAAGTSPTAGRVAGNRPGRAAGVAPRARIAAYKACWSAPDPADDGCSAADLVAAIDRATTDRVDVLNLSVGGPSEIDTVERALLGATEAGIVVVGAAGNRGDRAYAGHPSPWVTTVGATTGSDRVGVVTGAHGLRLPGAMASGARLPAAPLVYGDDAVAPGARRGTARRCSPGSLDAGRVDRAVVVCERGGGARVAKSLAVRRAGGVGMVLVNRGRASTDADLHVVPTVHLTRREGVVLARWTRGRQDPRVRLVSRGIRQTPVRVAGFSCGGDPGISLLKPDLVAPGTEVLAATPGGWDLTTGTSAAAAHVSGLAADLMSRPAATPERVRSALRTTARPLATAPAWRAGAGSAADRPMPDLSYLVPTRHYRAWLDGTRIALNQPSALLAAGARQVRRTVTNSGDRIIDVRADTEDFPYGVRVYPSYAELAPGDTLTFTVTLPGARGTVDGAVVWHTAGGQDTRLRVVRVR